MSVFSSVLDLSDVKFYEKSVLLFLRSQPVAVVVVAFSPTCPQLSGTAAGHLPETRATWTDSEHQAVPQWALVLRVTFPQC